MNKSIVWLLLAIFSGGAWLYRCVSDLQELHATWTASEAKRLEKPVEPQSVKSRRPASFEPKQAAMINVPEFPKFMTPVLVPQVPTSFGLPADPPKPATREERVADEYVKAHQEGWGVREWHELRATTFRAGTGTEVQYDVYQDGVRMVDMSIRLAVDADGTVSERSVRYEPIARVENTTTLEPRALNEIVRDRLGAMPSEENPEQIYVTTGGATELAYSVRLAAGSSTQAGTVGGKPSHAILRASDGQFLRYRYDE